MGIEVSGDYRCANFAQCVQQLPARDGLAQVEDRTQFKHELLVGDDGADNDRYSRGWRD